MRVHAAYDALFSTWREQWHSLSSKAFSFMKRPAIPKTPNILEIELIELTLFNGQTSKPFPKENAISECHDLFEERLKAPRSSRYGLSIKKDLRGGVNSKNVGAYAELLMDSLLKILSSVVWLIEWSVPRLLMVEVKGCVCNMKFSTHCVYKINTRKMKKQIRALHGKWCWCESLCIEKKVLVTVMGSVAWFKWWWKTLWEQLFQFSHLRDNCLPE